jgi:hypothetical protein
MHITKDLIVNTSVIGEVFENLKGSKILDVLGSEAESIKPLLIGKTIQKIERIGRYYTVSVPKISKEFESDYMTGWGFYFGSSNKSKPLYLKEDDWVYENFLELNDMEDEDEPAYEFGTITAHNIAWNDFVCNIGFTKIEVWNDYYDFIEKEYNHTFLEIKTTKGSFKINASLFDDESEFWDTIDVNPPKTEKQVQYALKAALEDKLDDDVELEVKCDTGRIDVLTINSIWEVKHVKHWLSAIGQVLRYSNAYPNHKLGICLFGKGENKVYEKAFEACQSRGIILTTDFMLAAKGFHFLSESDLSKSALYDDEDNYNPYDHLDEYGDLPYDPEYASMNPEYGYI